MASHWTFVFAAYGVTALGTAAILAQSWLWMRGAEKRVDALTQRGRAEQSAPETSVAQQNGDGQAGGTRS